MYFQWQISYHQTTEPFLQLVLGFLTKFLYIWDWIISCYKIQHFYKSAQCFRLWVYHDYSEQFYHAFLTGLFSGVNNVSVRSNLEVGEGRADVIVKNEYTNQAVVIELKITDSPKKAPAKCDEALQQIENNGYAVPLAEDEGYEVIQYGAVFYKKRCFIKKAE